eukprot:TRINITY_DN4126_c0_g1_i1.p1 TRINITY_DN4126_c0_g1~~TRINITY_DN4126_c0_g1_i1.p1  ORF type:complete len:1029 (-),score=123.87 TRINITY_DN4126_c0_g1_i1:80-3166(-)
MTFTFGTKDVKDLDAEELRNFLLSCEWASPQFVKLVWFNKLSGSAFLELTKQDLRNEYEIKELGTIKMYLREIRSLDPNSAERQLELDASAFSHLDDMDKMRTPSPRFERSGNTLNMSNTLNNSALASSTSAGQYTPTSTPLATSPRPFVGSDHKRPQNLKGVVEYAPSPTPTPTQPLSPPKPLVASFSTQQPPTVVTMQEYREFRANSPNKNAPPPKMKRKPKRKKKVAPREETEADRTAATRALAEAEASQEEFKARLREKLTTHFCAVDRDNRGYIRQAKLPLLLKRIFPSFSAKMLTDYTTTVLEDCDIPVLEDNAPTVDGKDPLGEKIFKEEFIMSITDKLSAVEAAFNIVDADGTGEITYLELETLLHSVFPTYSKKERQKYQAAIISECDASGEGAISLDEFITSQYANLLAEPAELEIRKRKRLAKLEELFSTVDVDHSGKISYDELRTLIQNVFPDYALRQQEAFFNVIVAECDKDNSGEIEFSEFVQSDYSNTMLAQSSQDEEVEKPKPKKRHRDRILDREAWTSKQRDSTRSDSLKGKDTLRITAMGSTATDQEVLDKNSAEAAQIRRQEREAEEAKMKEASMTDARRIARQRAMAVAEEAKWERMQEARDVLRRGARLQALGYVPGILEKERRLAYIKNIFLKWDESSDISRTGSGFIEYFELRSVLQRFYNWTDAEADANVDAVMSKLDKDLSGTLDFEEFVTFINDLTKSIQPKHFDTLMEFLWSAIADFSKDQEHDRRVNLLKQLFTSWDYNESGDVDQKELCRVLTRFNDMERDGGEEHFVELMFSGADENDDGSLDIKEFVNFFDDLTYKLTPGEFDFMIYRLRRCLEEVLVLLEDSFASLKYKQVLLNALEGYEMDDMLRDSKPFMPMICYGTACDPARAIEQYAQSKHIPVKAFLVTHDKAEITCIEGIQKWGYRLGYWILVVLGIDYEADGFLRQLGISLQTQSSMSPRFRLWIHAPYPDVKDFPAVFLCNARLESLDEIDPEDRGYSREELDLKRSQQVGKMIQSRT